MAMSELFSVRKKVYDSYEFGEEPDEAVVDSLSHNYPELAESMVCPSKEELAAWLNRNILPDPNDSFLLNRLPTEILMLISENLELTGLMALYRLIPRATKGHRLFNRLLRTVPEFLHALDSTNVLYSGHMRTKRLSLTVSTLLGVLKSPRCSKCNSPGDIVQLLGDGTLHRGEASLWPEATVQRYCYWHALLVSKDVITWSCAKKLYMLKESLEPWELAPGLHHITAVPGRYGCLGWECAPSTPDRSILVKKSDIGNHISLKKSNKHYIIFKGYEEMANRHQLEQEAVRRVGLTYTRLGAIYSNEKLARLKAAAKQETLAWESKLLVGINQRNTRKAWAECSSVVKFQQPKPGQLPWENLMNSRLELALQALSHMAFVRVPFVHEGPYGDLSVQHPVYCLPCRDSRTYRLTSEIQLRLGVYLARDRYTVYTKENVSDPPPVPPSFPSFRARSLSSRSPFPSLQKHLAKCEAVFMGIDMRIAEGLDYGPEEAVGWEGQ